MKYYLAIDIGASSGRHILGSVENGRIVLEEIYRFENAMREENGTLIWDLDSLTREVIAGIAVCKQLGKLPATVAIDTWGVDYVLLGEDGNPLLPAVAYRDSRTAPAVEAVNQRIPLQELYAKTGIWPQPFNTIYQLWCDRESGKLAKAKTVLLMPAYLSYALTGVCMNDYTDATTSGLINAETKTWDASLLAALGLDPALFAPPALPGTVVGPFTPAVREAVGFDATVLCAPAHDTAAAVAACPIDEESIYISSGTWSLIGTENRTPTLTEAARLAGFTNEGGVEYHYRFLKNIMGMWLFQNIRKNLNKQYTYDEMMAMAQASSYTQTFDCNDPSLLAPENMIAAIRALLGAPELPLGDVLSSVYHSLAHSYDTAIREIETLSQKTVSRILIVGGGSKDRYLNALTASVTGKPVYTGLSEATALGNLLSQIMQDTGRSLAEGRALIAESFRIRCEATPES
ncbi:MAG: rhamnulokinase [Clostridia bacterium]|nr:rhamnulokinase [Clostridia bacterium]